MKRDVKDGCLPRGRVVIYVYHDDGRVDHIPIDNIVVNGGRDRFAALVAQVSTVFPSHIAIGTGTTAATVTDTAMETEVDRNVIGTTTSSAGVVTFKAFFSKTEANGNTISEVGLFDQASGGTMICHSILGATVAKDATISLSIIWTLTFADS